MSRSSDGQPYDYDFIVTGACGLIGRTLVPFLYRSGYSVLELDLSHGHDLTDESKVRALFHGIRARCLINLFALNEHVNHATHMQNKSIYDFELTDIENYLKVNVSALFCVCREYLRNNEVGAIINFSSIHGERIPDRSLYDGGIKHIGYCLSKGAVTRLTEYLAKFSTPTQRINTIVLGGVQDAQGERFTERYVARVPTVRMAIVEDLYPIIHMLSRPDIYVTGAAIRCDGGWLI